jgi:two-component system response regulator YesN
VYCHYPAPGEKLRHLLECANEVISDLNNGRSKRIRLLLQVILEQFRIDIAGGENIAAAEIPEVVAQALHYIDLNYTGNINCSAVAEALQVNRTQLSELFHRTTGETMKDYILALRLERACWLLKETQMKINRIAAECGFASAGYFIKVFRKKYQLTPAEYRTTQTSRQ